MRRKIAKVLDERINPQVAEHGGRIDVVDYANGSVFVVMSGGCQGCAASTATLKQGVAQVLKEAFGERVQDIVDVTEHEKGESPYYASMPT
jgi:Fe/S biogenesis protein NfuA